ncbi:unnamed protein product [Phaedon cochleariae]|uniref:Sphingomyelin phosphodiesterase n=1 Tax=Phaedon cochleariae TaxID=80249 RepID=A0A9P0DT59_PHACE|nr:unnamed protein product [Phaedon cochleariae]
MKITGCWSTFPFLMLCLLLYGTGGSTSFDKITTNELRCLEKEMALSFKILKYKEMELKDFQRELDNLNLTEPLHRFFNPKGTLCKLCQLLIGALKKRTIRVENIARAICNIYIALSTWTLDDFCEDIIELNMPIIEYVLENSEIFSPELACTILLQNDKCYYPDSALTWRMSTPSTSLVKFPQVILRQNAKRLKILHLSDFHITPDYEIGGISNCGYPTCCKKGLGNPIGSKPAGVWGDYECDVPPWMFGTTLDHIKYAHKDIDIVYFTGDIIDHTVWQASKEQNSRLIYYTYKALYETFPNIPVFAVIGNHEAAPLNAFAPPDAPVNESLSTQWLYTLMSKAWRPWLPPDALKTVKRQGYYAHSVNKKLKIIGLNNNVCYNLNWWLLYNTAYLSEQLKFLSDELLKSEQNEQFVHILAHVPVGNEECIEPWEENYNAIVERFSHIIQGQFYGHTHTDELKIFYKNYSEPINVGYNGGSLTPYTKFNPNYKVMTVDPDSYEVIDVETYIFNLTEANQHSNLTPNWLKMYSMQEAYGLNKLSPQNFDQLVDDIFEDENLADLYWRFYVRFGDPSLEDGCDRKCKKDLICKIVTTRSMFPSKPNCR